MLGPLGQLEVSGAAADRRRRPRRAARRRRRRRELRRQHRARASAPARLLELNTGELHARPSLGRRDQRVPSGFKLAISGSVEFLGLATATGSVDDRDPQRQVRARVRRRASTLGPFTVQAAGARRHLRRREPGLVLRLAVSLDVEHLRDHQDQRQRRAAAEHDGRRPHARAASRSARSRSASRSTGEIKILEVIKLDASFVIQVGGGAA